jgi:hypothetical protein
MQPKTVVGRQNSGLPTFTAVKDIGTHPSVGISKTLYTAHSACADNEIRLICTKHAVV